VFSRQRNHEASLCSIGLYDLTLGAFHSSALVSARKQKLLKQISNVGFLFISSCIFQLVIYGLLSDTSSLPPALLVGLYGPYSEVKLRGIHELLTQNSETTSSRTQQNQKTVKAKYFKLLRKSNKAIHFILIKGSDGGVSHSELLGFLLCPSSGILELENTTFRKLDLFPSSGDGGVEDTYSVGSVRKS
jgi:hypothetical protein